MAYNVNGKVFTDHPLMDEIVYNCKQILKGIVIKNDILAADKETETSLINAEMYYLIHDNGYMTFEQIAFNEEMLSAYGCTDAEIKSYLIDRNNIPESIRSDLTNFCNQWFVDNFEESNDYYRMLMGLPPYNTGEEYYIYIDESYIPSSYEGYIDYTIPLHEQPNNIITILYANDSISRLRDEYKGAEYSYILFLGDRSIDLYKARRANKWDILYMPNVYYIIEDRFTDLYSINRQLYINKSYQEFFAEYGDYYDEMMILIVLAQTFNDLIVEVPEWYIRRDVFDIRSCRYFTEAAGVDFYPIIPLKYQIRIVKNLNKLVKYKSSIKSIHDILDVFDVKGMKIYRYWIFRKYITTITPEELDDGAFNFGDIDLYDETAIGDYDFGDEDEGVDPESVATEDYDFVRPVDEIEVVIKPTTDDGAFNFGDIDEDDETAVGDYDFGDLDGTNNKASAAVDDYDFNFLGEENNLDPSNPDIPPEPMPYDQYDLQFIKSPIEESFDAYIRDSKYRSDYYSIVSQDKFWNGSSDPEYIKELTLDQAFTVHGTKFMGIEYEIPMAEYLYQMEYFLGLLINSDLDTSDITVYVPSINETVPFVVSKLFLFLVILTASYSREEGDDSTLIRYENVWKGPMVNPSEDYWDWKKKVLPEIYVRKEGRVHCYNPDVDIPGLIELLERKHSHIRFGESDNFNLDPLYIGDEEYKNRADAWIESMGIYDYTVCNEVIDNFQDLIGIYKSNKECHDKLKNLMINADNQDDLKTYQYVYQELYTRDYDRDINRLSDGSYATDLIDLLRDVDFVLYQKYNDIMNESNIESRQEVIRKVMNDIIDTLEYYLSGDGLEYLFSFTAVESFEAVVEYLNLMIGFFKSYKVYFLDPYISFTTDDQLENSAKPIDVINEFNYEYLNKDKALIADSINRFEEEELLEDRDMLHTLEILDIYSHHDPDPLSDQDYNGWFAEELSDYTDVDGRYADDISTYPYTMINCGAAYEGIINIDNLDGGHAEEIAYEVYYQIDGGTEYDRDEQQTDHRGSQMFTYVVDGGSADSKWFRSNTMEFYMKGTEFDANVIISNKPENYIEINDDGLYLSDDNYISQSQFDNYIASINNMVELIQTEAIDVAEDYVVLSDEDALKARIDLLTDNYLYYIEYVVPRMVADPIGKPFIESVNRYTDNSIQVLDNMYKDNLDPYAWTDL